MALLSRAKGSKRWDHKPEQIFLDDGTLGWRIFLTRLDVNVVNPEPLVAQPFSYIIEEGDLNLSVMDPVTAVAAYHADVELEWAATTTPPVLSAEADGIGRLVFRQPTSINGPWTYTVELTDHTADATTQLTPEPALTVVKSPGPHVGGLILGADITLPLTGLTPGHEYSATVTVDCVDYERAATSLASERVTVPEPPESPEP
ncbi:hypothetical protein [Mycobacterium riyadhense]|uniref:hypothetical protein n=1 Tax=Mycobacterium riyadhense TaxID=486698 RepID=UPI00195C1279|nr:hypothetical protein [Mycobacterium riyadhense]